LSKDAWVFENLYATGTRSVRGIEAVVTGFNPTPARAVVKLSKSQQGFYSIAETLKEVGYQTQFIYGGESHFDNMKSFFLGNGFQLIHDLPKFTNPKFVGSWGASDEDLYREAHQQFIKLNQQGKPFFSLVFTSSNHSPFEFPAGCVEPVGTVRASVENAVRYTDCALGKFIEQAKQADYWKNTVFLVVADHDSRAFGSEIVPIEHFDIPALIFGEGITPRKDTRLVSQIDLPQTLLSLAGINSVNPMTGFDLTRELPVEKQRALMQYQENFAWMTPELITVFLPGEQVKVFQHDGQQIGAELTVNNPRLDKLVKAAKAQALWGNLAYEKGLFKELVQLKTKSIATNHGLSEIQHFN
jgi:phosphoglycerol transferase MdoB-like AlkP superfamily enzyme